jgi:hypothetical protein
MAKANTDKRPAEILHPMPDDGLLRSEPRVKIFLPHVHGTAHRDEQIEIIHGWDRLAGIQFDRAPFIAVFPPELAKGTGVLHCNVLEDQNAHQRTLSVIGRRKVA